MPGRDPNAVARKKREAATLLRKHTARHVGAMTHHTQLAEVKKVPDPDGDMEGFVADLVDGTALTEPDDFTVSQWVRFYHRTSHVQVGDTFVMVQTRDGDFVATDVLAETRPLRWLPSDSGGDNNEFP